MSTSQLGKKTQCRSLFLRTKGLCALLLQLLPGPPPNLQEGGQRAIFQRPPVYLGNKPTLPRREGSFGGSPKSQPPLPQETAAPAPRPGPVAPRRPRTRPGKGRGGEPAATAPVPRNPPTSRSRARRALRASRSRARGKAEPRVPRREEAAAPRTPGGGGGRNPGALGGQYLPPEPARTPGA